MIFCIGFGWMTAQVKTAVFKIRIRFLQVRYLRFHIECDTMFPLFIDKSSDMLSILTGRSIYYSISKDFFFTGGSLLIERKSRGFAIQRQKIRETKASRIFWSSALSHGRYARSAALASFLPALSANTRLKQPAGLFEARYPARPAAASPLPIRKWG